MENKLNDVREIRQSIIRDSSSKSILNTYVEDIVEKNKDEQQVIVKEIIEEANNVKSFLLAPNKNAGCTSLAPFRAGQYISLKVVIDGIPTNRAYSLSSSPKEADNGIYRITIKRVNNGLVSNYMLDKVKVGDKFIISKPAGDFGYYKNMDEDNVIAICGGSGIAPFMSLAKAILDGYEDCFLTVFYSTRTVNDIIFKKEIEAINKRSKKVKFIITLTKETSDEYLFGRINIDMLENYINEFNTVLMCGPKVMYQSMNEILSELDIPKKAVRYENYYIPYQPNFIQEYDLKIINKDDEQIIPCYSNETLLVAMEKAGVKAPALCRVGECGFCRSILVEGKIKLVGAIQPRSLAQNDYIHPCVSYPESDIIIRLDF